MTRSIVEVGAFSFDTATSELSGPAEYMKSAEYRAVINSITSGTNHTFTYAVTSGESPDPVTALLVVVQIDYAAWKGARAFHAAREARRNPGRAYYDTCLDDAL